MPLVGWLPAGKVKGTLRKDEGEMRTVVPDSQVEILPPRGPALRPAGPQTHGPQLYARPRRHPEERRRRERRAGEPHRGQLLDLYA